GEGGAEVDDALVQDRLAAHGLLHAVQAQLGLVDGALVLGDELLDRRAIALFHVGERDGQAHRPRQRDDPDHAAAQLPRAARQQHAADQLRADLARLDALDVDARDAEVHGAAEQPPRSVGAREVNRLVVRNPGRDPSRLAHAGLRQDHLTAIAAAKARTPAVTTFGGACGTSETGVGN